MSATFQVVTVTPAWRAVNGEIRRVEIIIDAVDIVGALPIVERVRLLERYGGLTIEGSALRNKMSRVEIRMREVADMRKVGAL